MIQILWMRLPNNMMTTRTTTLALLITLATIMASVESLIQSPVPFLRLGLANGITLLVLKWYGFREGLTVTLFRVILAGLITGRLFQPTFFLSLSGGLTAVLVMAFLLRWESRWFSLIGISIAGAFFHNLTQWLVASVLVRQFVGLSFLPLLFLASVVAGMMIGYFSMLIDQAVRKQTGRVG